MRLYTALFRADLAASGSEDMERMHTRTLVAQLGGTRATAQALTRAGVKVSQRTVQRWIAPAGAKERHRPRADRRERLLTLAQREGAEGIAARIAREGITVRGIGGTLRVSDDVRGFELEDVPIPADTLGELVDVLRTAPEDKAAIEAAFTAAFVAAWEEDRGGAGFHGASVQILNVDYLDAEFGQRE